MINLELQITDFMAIFESRKDDIMDVLAAAMQTNRAMMFDQDGADNGKQAWAPLKWRRGRPLQKRGTLRKSFAPVNDGIRPGRGQDSIVQYAYPMVTIGTTLAYAKPLNDGFIARPVKAKALKIPLPEDSSGFSKKEKDQGFIFRKSVTVPSRRMDIVTEQDEQEIATTLENFITEILNDG